MNGKYTGGDEKELFVTMVNIQQIRNARRHAAARRTAQAAARWKREIRARRFWKRIMLALAALLLMEVGGVIALALASQMFQR